MASTTFVDGETLIEASWLNDVNAAVYTTGTQTAADIANVPAGSIAATNVQAALNELDGDIQTKQPLDSLLTSLAGQTTAANNVQAYSGVDTATLLSTGTANGNIPLVGTSSATELLAGLVELATTTEAAAGTDTTRAVTPAGLSAGITALAPAPIKAWVNFDGTGVGPSLPGQAGLNIASITKNGTGDYTIAFSTPLADTNYAVIVTGNESKADTAAARNNLYSGYPVTTSSARVSSFDVSNAAVDSAVMSVVIIR